MSRPQLSSLSSASSGSQIPQRMPSWQQPIAAQLQANGQTKSGEGFQTVQDFILSLPHPQYWPGLVLTILVLDPLRALAVNFIALVTSPRTHRVILRLSILAALFWASLILAIFAYIGFYRAWVPEAGRIQEFHLQYGQAGQMPSAVVDISQWSTGSGDDWFAEEQEYDVTAELLVPISAANLDLGNFMVSLDLVTADNVPLFRISKPTILRPTTPPMRFFSQVAAHVGARPSLGNGQFLPLPFTSPALDLMEVKLFDRLIVHPSPGRVPFSNPAGSPIEESTGRRRVAKAILKVGREDSDRYWMYGGGHGVGGVVMGSNGEVNSPLNGMVLASQTGGAFRSRGELQTVGVALRFDAKLSGLRYMLYNHPVLSFLIFTSLFLTFELISALTLWTIAAFYTSSLPGLDVNLAMDNQLRVYPEVDEEDQDNDRGSGSDDGDSDSDGQGPGGRGSGGGNGLRRRRRSKRGERRYFGDDDGESSSTETERDTSGSSFRYRGQGRPGGEASSFYPGSSSETPPPAAAAAAQQEQQASQGGIPPTSEDLLTPGYRRILGRLDEETEEETDYLGSEDAGGDNLTSSSRASSITGAMTGVAESAAAAVMGATPGLTRPESLQGRRRRGGASSSSEDETLEGDEEEDEEANPSSSIIDDRRRRRRRGQEEDDDDEVTITSSSSQSFTPDDGSSTTSSQLRERSQALLHEHGQAPEGQWQDHRAGMTDEAQDEARAMQRAQSSFEAEAGSDDG